MSLTAEYSTERFNQIRKYDKEELKLIDGTVLEQVSNFESVSYTHLDVYKRQVLQHSSEARMPIRK